MSILGQRSKIQEESLYYGHKKHDGSLPIIGVNTFLPPDGHGEVGEAQARTKAMKGPKVRNG